MKKLLLPSFLLFAALVVFKGRSAPVAYGSFTVTNNHTVSTNIIGTNSGPVFMRATLIGLKAGGVSNAATVFVGPVTGATYYVIAPGERHIIEVAPPTQGTTANFRDWWLRTPTTGDGLHIIYQ